MTENVHQRLYIIREQRKMKKKASKVCVKATVLEKGNKPSRKQQVKAKLLKK